MKLFYERFRCTCANLTLHGPSFMVRKDIHIAYRLIYFIIYIHIWAAVIMTIRKYYDHYQENMIRFTTITDYLHWNTTFPSITICEILNVDKIWMLHQSNDVPKQGKLDRLIGDVAFFSGTCYSCMNTCDNDLDCPKDFKELTDTYRAPCKKLFLSCIWNGIPINCCQYFRPLETEFGTCFSLNNRQIRERGKYFVSANKKTELASLELVISQDYEAFLHSPEDVPFWNMEYDRRLTVLYGSQAGMVFSITEIVNEPEVSFISPEVRQCRFEDELPYNFRAYKLYSYSTCITQCRINAQLDICNCTHHHSPSQYKDQYCDVEGLSCLTTHYNLLRKLKVPNGNETGLECECLPSCTEPDYNVVAHKLIEPQEDMKMGSAKFILSNRPYQRITRQVARTTLDLVVAMGNCFGLCFGGSLLSIVEIIYYLFFKKWGVIKDY